LENRFERTPDGQVWTSESFGYPFFCRYLEGFDEVCIVARAREVGELAPSRRAATGEGVELCKVPYFLGPWPVLRMHGRVRRTMRETIRPDDAVILRVPGTLGTVIEGVIAGGGRPFGVEVVGDPFDVFAPGSVKHVGRRFFRWWYPRALRRQCGAA